jgi:hypothetical protein
MVLDLLKMLSSPGEQVSLWLSWPTIILSLGVVYHWLRFAWQAFKRPPQDRTRQCWFIIGVTVAFFGDSVDNLYWGIAWSIEFVYPPDYENAWFALGALPNIVFRQLAGMYAAYCHMRAYYHDDKLGLSRIKLWYVTSILLGGIYVAILNLFHIYLE